MRDLTNTESPHLELLVQTANVPAAHQISPPVVNFSPQDLSKNAVSLSLRKRHPVRKFSLLIGGVLGFLLLLGVLVTTIGPIMPIPGRLLSPSGGSSTAKSPVNVNPPIATQSVIPASPTAIQSVTPTPTVTTQPVTPTPTTAPVINANPYFSSQRTLILSDTLQDNSKGSHWDEATVSDGSFCQFTGGAYHANQTDARYVHQCLAEATDYTNFTFEIQMSIVKGSGASGGGGGGGIVFRGNNAIGFYDFTIFSNGNYSVYRFDPGGVTPVLISGSSSSIKTGLKVTNVLAVVANGTALSFYVNHQKIGSVNDSTYTHGAIGVIVTDAPSEAAFSNVQVWT